MKTKLFLVAVLLICGATFARPDSVDWDAFSQNLTKALKSDNAGLQQSAMCMVIQYADHLTIPRDAVFNIVRVFRSDKDKNVRLLALVTLHKIEDPWAMDFLQRHRRYEKETRLKQICCCAVNTYYAKRDSIKAEKAQEILAQVQDQIINENFSNAAQTLDIEQYGF